MTIDDVIESSYMTGLDVVLQFNLLEWIIAIICCGFFGFVCGLFIVSLFIFKEDESILFGLTFATIICATIIFLAIVKTEIKTATPEGWREDIAEVYYEELPIIKKEIEVISIKNTDEWYIYEVTFREKLEQHIVTPQKITVKVVRDPRVMEPIYEYKEIEKDIPHFKHQGKYEEMVRVPTDFER